MMYGFETRLLTDKVLKLFLDSIPKIDSSGVQMMKKTRPHAMFNPITGKRYNFNPNEELEYNDFELETWKEQKTPICYWGTLRGTKKLRKLCKQYKINYYNLDHSYFFRTSHQSHLSLNTPNYRVTFNAENINFLCNDKFEQEDYEHINFYRKSTVGDQLLYNEGLYKNSKKQHILLCPPSEHACNYYEMDDSETWISNTQKLIQKHTDRPIVIRKKQLNFEKPLLEDLQNAYCIVTHQSTAAIAAILNGVPSICDASSCAAPVSSTKIEDIENLTRPDNDLIYNWVNSLLACQFPTHKLADGYAKRAVDRLQSQNDNNT